MFRGGSHQKQGTALGVSGVGNVGAAVTKFLAPFVLVAYGWQAVAQIWAVGIAIMAIAFWFFTDDDPVLVARRARGEKPRSAWLELEPSRTSRSGALRSITSLSSATEASDDEWLTMMGQVGRAVDPGLACLKRAFERAVCV